MNADVNHLNIKDTGCAGAKKQGYQGGCLDCPMPDCLEPATVKMECQLTGSEHIWTRQKYTRDIDRGVCDCKAVRYLPRNSKESTTRECRRLNDKKGKPGGIYGGPPLPDELAQLNIKPSQTLRTFTGLSQDYEGQKDFRSTVSIQPEKKEGTKMELTKTQREIYQGSPPKQISMEKARASRGKKCETCSNAFTAPSDGERHCGVKKCPSRIPAKLRLSYKEKETAPAAPPMRRRVVYCPQDCQCPAGECGYVDKKSTNKKYPQCPDYKEPIGTETALGVAQMKVKVPADPPPADDRVQILEEGLNAPPAPLPEPETPSSDCKNVYFCPRDCQSYSAGLACPGRESGLDIVEGAVNINLLPWCPSYDKNFGYPPLEKAAPKPDTSVHTINVRVDTSEIDAKIEKFNKLCMSALPRPRWWWSQQTLRYYMATVERLLK